MFGRKGKLPAQQRLIIYPRLYTVAELGLPAKNPFGERADEPAWSRIPCAWPGFATGSRPTA